MALLLPAIVLFLLTVGIALMIAGWRGRRIDDHPLCRRCGFDLIGKPAGGTVCPECGADVSQRGAVRFGHRTRQWGRVWSGVALLLFSALLIVSFTAGATFNRYKPTALLGLEATYRDGKASDAAMAEILSRQSAGSLSRGQVDSLVERALWIQADRSRPWNVRWGDLVEAARAANQVSDEDWRRYARQAASNVYSIEVRKNVRRGDPFPIWTSEANVRCGSKQTFVARFKREFTLSGVPYDKDYYSEESDSLMSGVSGRSGVTLDLSPQVLARLTDGPQNVVVDVAIRVCEGQHGSDTPIEGALIQEKWQASWFLQDQPTVAIVRDPAKQGEIAAGLSVTRASFPTYSPDMLQMQVQTMSLPVGIGFDVYVRMHGREVRVGNIARKAGTGRYGFGFGEHVPELAALQAANPAKTIDVIFRSSSAAAARTLDVEEIWEGEIVLKDVPFPTGK